MLLPARVTITSALLLTTAKLATVFAPLAPMDPLLLTVLLVLPLLSLMLLCAWRHALLTSTLIALEYASRAFRHVRPAMDF